MTGGDVLDRTVLEVGEHVQGLLGREASARRDGFLQSVTPTVTLVGLLALVLLAAFQRRIATLAVLGTAAVGLAVASRLGPKEFLGRALAVSAMIGLVLAPRAVLVPGETLVGPVTVAGALAVVRVVARVFVCVALVTLLLSTTRFADVLAALDRLGAPTIAVSLLSTTHRYLLVFFAELARTVRARRSRQIEPHSIARGWRETGSLLGSFFVRVLERGEGVQRAVRARGGPGTDVYGGQERLGRADYAFAAVVVATAVLALGASP